MFQAHSTKLFLRYELKETLTSGNCSFLKIKGKNVAQRKSKAKIFVAAILNASTNHRKTWGKHPSRHDANVGLKNSTGIFLSFQFEWKKRNTSGDFDLFRNPSTGISCTI